ncbi:hypothetical protein [Demequina sp.]|uniref:hypothetical protein n=1 Tax=Demequina sp. TaxID=2050685 RepID=UPI003A88F3F0
MGILRSPAFLAAVAITVIVAVYFAFVAEFAVAFLRADELDAKIMGGALLVLPTVGVWYLVHEWRLGITVQRMANELDRDGALPVHDGETTAAGRLTDEAAERVFEAARLEVEARPEQWEAWFAVSHAYDANRDRSMARKSMQRAAQLYRAQRRAAR